MYESKAFRSSALCACRFLANCAFQLAASLFIEVFSGVVSSDSEPAGNTHCSCWHHLRLQPCCTSCIKHLKPSVLLKSQAGCMQAKLAARLAKVSVPISIQRTNVVQRWNICNLCLHRHVLLQLCLKGLQCRAGGHERLISGLHRTWQSECQLGLVSASSGQHSTVQLTGHAVVPAVACSCTYMQAVTG